MYVYVYIHVYVYTAGSGFPLSTKVYGTTFMCIRMCRYVYVYVDMYMCMYMYMYICMYMPMAQVSVLSNRHSPTYERRRDYLYFFPSNRTRLSP